MHAYSWPSAENMRRACELGVLAAIQPACSGASPPRWRIGSVAPAPREPVRCAIGSTLASRYGGSDGPDFAWRRCSASGQATTRRVQGFADPLGPEQEIRAQALAMYTTAAARYCFAERERGALRPGLAADWACLSRT